MRSKIYFRRKAVISSIFICFILIIVSTAIPMTYGKQLIENKTQANPIQNTMSNDDILSYIDNNNNNPMISLWLNLFKGYTNKLMPGFDFTIDDEILAIISNFFNIEKDEVSIHDYNTLVSDKIEPLKNELLRVKNNEISIEELNPKIQQLLQDIDDYLFKKIGVDKSFDNDIVTPSINLANNDFNEYMTIYNKIVRYWNFFGSEDMDEWTTNAAWLEWFMPFLSIFFFFFAFLIFVLVDGGESIAFILISGVTFFDILITYLDIRIHYCWHQLTFLGIDINMRNVNPITTGEEEIKGIDNLENYIIAHNVNIESEFPYLLDKFTYTFGLTDASDEDGWYALSNWWKAEKAESFYEKTPMPPGEWHIDFIEHPNYILKEENGYRIPVQLNASSIYTFTHQINTNPSVPEDIITLGSTTVNVGDILYFETKSYDPDPIDTIYFQFHWGDELGEWSDNSIQSGNIYRTNHSWSEPGCYEVKTRAKDNTGRIISCWSNTTKILVLP